MTRLINTIGSYLNPDVLQGLSQKIGADQSAVQSAVGAAIPLLINALGRNAADDQGAEEITSALREDHSGSLLDNLMGFIQGNALGRDADGPGILEHILGSRRSAVEKGVSRTSGLDFGQVAQLLTILGPVVMGALGKQRQENGLDANGVQQLLQNEREETTSQLNGLERLIDRDNDGKIGDDLFGIGTRILGGIFSRN